LATFLRGFTVPSSAAPDNPIKPVYSIPDFDEPEPGRPLVAFGTVIGASVVVVVVEVVVVEVVVVVVGATVVVAGGTYFFFGATVVVEVVVVVVVVVVVGIETLAIAEIAEIFSVSGKATYPDGNEV
jgi:hypothetical protein